LVGPQSSMYFLSHASSVCYPRALRTTPCVSVYLPSAATRHGLMSVTKRTNLRTVRICLLLSLGESTVACSTNSHSFHLQATLARLFTFFLKISQHCPIDRQCRADRCKTQVFWRELC
jgi:hypothetical protein